MQKLINFFFNGWDKESNETPRYEVIYITIYRNIIYYYIYYIYTIYVIYCILNITYAETGGLEGGGAAPPQILDKVDLLPIDNNSEK